MWIEELKHELTGRRLDIWRGHDDTGKPVDLPSAMLEQYRQLWREQFRDPSVPLPNLEECPFHGPDLRDEHGKAITRECVSCGGRFNKLKVFSCTHPARKDEVTVKDCQSCVHRPIPENEHASREVRPVQPSSTS